jgi:opacity protein-like surface antigen
MRSIKVAIAAGAVMALTATAAFAAVTFDPETGEGFVGKGDVQEAFGWNNRAVNDNAADVTFTFEEQASYTFVCSRVQQQHGYQEQTFNNKVIGVDADVEFEKRRNGGNGNLTGFLLTGFGEESEFTGEGCPSGWPDEVSRTLNEAAGDGGLFAHYGDESVLLDWPEVDEE